MTLALYFCSILSNFYRRHTGPKKYTRFLLYWRSDQWDQLNVATSNWTGASRVAPLIIACGNPFEEFCVGIFLLIISLYIFFTCRISCRIFKSNNLLKKIMDNFIFLSSCFLIMLRQKKCYYIPVLFLHQFC